MNLLLPKVNITGPLLLPVAFILHRALQLYSVDQTVILHLLKRVNIPVTLGIIDSQIQDLFFSHFGHTISYRRNQQWVIN